MQTGNVTEQDVTDLIQLTSEAAKALISGDMAGYFSRMIHADDFTLMPPTGGARRGFDLSEEVLAELAEFFGGGEAELEVIDTYASGDLVVLVIVERQHGEVGGLPDQDWSLRVTWVFRQEADGWVQVHRHADPMTHEISLEQAAALARG